MCLQNLFSLSQVDYATGDPKKDAVNLRISAESSRILLSNYKRLFRSYAESESLDRGLILTILENL